MFVSRINEPWADRLPGCGMIDCVAQHVLLLPCPALQPTGELEEEAQLEAAVRQLEDGACGAAEAHRKPPRAVRPLALYPPTAAGEDHGMDHHKH